MTTKLSRYADGVMEAAWLAAIIMAPLYFNKYSYRIFEPDKAALVRSLALLMLLSWGIKLAAQALVTRKSLKNLSIKQLSKNPLLLAVAVVAVSSIISTIFSVIPRISFWGSYVRLQGLYTTLAYLVLVITLVANLRSHEQVKRLITTAILTSLPISLYAILQHFGIDPIPWGGDVTRRVAANMGNPIFVAAFLILIFPPTVGRIVDSFQKILRETEDLVIHTARATVYIFIAALQLIAIFYSQSRGPWLGLFSGGFFLFLLLSLLWRKRWLTFSFIGLALLAAVFLIVLNIPGGPLEGLQRVESFNRLGQLLNTQSRTARVRSLIWGGAAQMVAPHEPLEYPDGRKDLLNIIRPLVGYGPETMHWAYNRFYPPELAYVEARNASPDRSHNETWDSLVFTGVLGFLAYLTLFTSVFYYGLKWLDLVQDRKQRITFFSIYFGSGTLGAVVFAIWQGISFAGLGLPFGLLLGLIIYLAIVALIYKPEQPQSQPDHTRALLLSALLSALVSHFAEINFGISIVSTKTYLYLYVALLTAVGLTLPNQGLYTSDTNRETPHPNSPDSRRKKMRSRRAPTQRLSFEPSMMSGGILAGILLLPMIYEYIANLENLTSASKILWTSFTQVSQTFTSYGVLALILTTWIAATILLASESKILAPELPWWQTFGSILGISALISLLYGVWLSTRLAFLASILPRNINDLLLQTSGLEGLTTQFYSIVFIGLLCLGWFISAKTGGRTNPDSPLALVIAITGTLAAIGLVVTTNLRIIHADIAFKLAEPFANSAQWQVADVLYRRAIDLAPDEDFYYLMLGRASLEYAKTLSDETEKEQAFRTAETDLLRALKISPLNPDHTRNLARLHSWWALQASDEAIRHERGAVSDQYFSKAINLSPNNVVIWNEWASMQYQVFDDLDRAMELIKKSLEIDPKYDWTQAFAGDIFMETARTTDDEVERRELIHQSIGNYQEAIILQPLLNYYYALANAYNALEDTEMVIHTLEESLLVADTNSAWKIEENLAHYYLKLSDREAALTNARKAFNSAPDTELARLQDLIDQLQAIP